jgi:hypothetical protein
MVPGQYDHRFTAGDDYQVTVTLSQNGTPVDTSTYTFSAQVREGYLPDGEIKATFTVSPVTGGCVLSLTGEQTRSLANRKRLVWDLQSVSGQVRTWLTGAVHVTPEVTDDGS